MSPSGFWLPHAGPPRKGISVALGAGDPRRKCPKTHGQNRRNAMTLNRLTLIGFVGADAETKTNGNGSAYTVFSVATKTSWKNTAGAWESRTEWHRCVANGRIAGFPATLKKGPHVQAEGELRSPEYEKD